MANLKSQGNWESKLQQVNKLKTRQSKTKTHFDNSLQQFWLYESIKMVHARKLWNVIICLWHKYSNPGIINHDTSYHVYNLYTTSTYLNCCLLTGKAKWCYFELKFCWNHHFLYTTQDKTLFSHHQKYLYENKLSSWVKHCSLVLCRC